MKINWGQSIAIFYTLFVICMVGMVIKSTFHNPHLVQENYYQMDLDYEAFRTKRENARLLKDTLRMVYNDKVRKLEVQFPHDMTNVTGDISLFRPSNKYLDQKYDIKTNDENSMFLSLPDSTLKGLWKVQVDWLNEGTPYFKETVIKL